MRSIFFDAHLDLAYLGLMGRDMAAPAETQVVPDPPVAVTFPSLAEGGVRACLATIFTEADGADAAIAYPAPDAEAALAAGLAQLELYQEWLDAGWIAPLTPPGLAEAPGAAAAEEAEGEAFAPLMAGILIEGADPIRDPEDVEWWRRYGVVAVGMAWWKPSRYAGGNGTDIGLSGRGRGLAQAMDAAGLVHDLSHLSQRATDDLLAFTETPGGVIASHSNVRSLLDGVNQRHLADETVREIGRRGGMVGINLVSHFLRVGPGRKEGGARASIENVCDHVEMVCGLMGHRAGVGLGTDMDGGFPASWLPEGIDRPADLGKIVEALRRRGWSQPELDGFAFGNWARFWRERL
jgi:membrane dipeptidase